MLIFIALALGAFFVVAGAFLFGHDDLGHDVGADAGHDVGHDGDGTISIFSTRVIFTFLMGFGAAGAIATYYGAGYPIASLIGVASGIVLGAIMYGILVLFIKEQSSSVISQRSFVGQTGTVTVPIDANGTGEVGISAGQSYRAYSARSKDSSAIDKVRQVKIVESSGSMLIVEEIK